MMWPVAGRDDHSAYLLGGKIQRWPWIRNVKRTRPHREQNLANEPGLVDMPIDGVEEAVHLHVGLRDALAQIWTERRKRTDDSSQPAEEADTACLQYAQIKITTALTRVWVTDQLQGTLSPCRGDIGHSIDGTRKPAGSREPPEDVHASIAPWHAGVTGRRQRLPRAPHGQAHRQSVRLMRKRRPRAHRRKGAPLDCDTHLR
jgi:hypothetical protein